MSRLAGNNEAFPLFRLLGRVTGGAGSTGVFGSFANPFGRDVKVTNTVVEIITQSTGASTLDIGVAANATTSNDRQIDGASGAAAGFLSAGKNAGTNGNTVQNWGAAQFLNVAEASGDVNGLVADIYVEVVLL